MKTGFGATVAVVFIEAVKFTGVELAVADSDELVVMEIENRLEVGGNEFDKLDEEEL